VLVDQFEEVFTLSTDTRASIGATRSFHDISQLSPGAARRKAFINNLIYAAGIAGGKTIVVLTMRADFYGKCASYPNLAAALSEHQDLVGPMTREELREVIERPAQLVGLELERGLTEMLLRDMEDQPGALPLLQHALWELWQRREGRRLTIAAYTAIGGLEGALEQQANAIFEGMSRDEQETCRRIFLRLTQPGEGSEDTKCRVAVTQLGDSAAVSSVINRLTDVRLITAEKGSFVEVSHEALIRSWSKLRTWIEADREALRTQHRLTEAAAEWAASGKSADYLYQGARLAETEEWSKTPEADLTRHEQEFLTASLELRDRAKRDEEERKTRELETLKKLADSEAQRAGEQAHAARRSKRLSFAALGLAAAALVAFVWAAKAQRDAEGARTRIEETLAGNLLDRIHLEPGPFGVNEFPAYWQIAGLPAAHERLRSLILSNGLKNPDSATRLANRAPNVAQALVGLDAKRRGTFVSGLLMPVLKADSSPQPAKLAAVRLGIALMMDGGEFADQSVRTLSTGLVECSDIRSLDALADDLKTTVRLFAANETSHAVGPIVDAMQQTGDVRVLRRLCEAVALAGTMPHGDRIRMADRLLREMNQKTEPDVIRELIGCLAAFPETMPLLDAVGVVKSVVNAIDNSGNPDVQATLAAAMESVAVRLQPAECRAAADEILTAMKAAEDSESERTFARCLNAVAFQLARTDDAAGTRLILDAMQIMKQPDPMTVDPSKAVPLKAEPLHELAKGLGRPNELRQLTGKVAEPEGREAVTRLLEVMENTIASHELGVLAESLILVPVKLTDEEAAKATAKLLSQLTEDSLPPDIQELAMGLAALPGTLSLADSQSSFKIILGRLDRATKSQSIGSIRDALQPLGGKLSPDAAEAVAEPILAAMTGSQDSEKLLALASALRGMQEVLSAATIKKSYLIVLAKMHEPRFALPIDLSILAKCLAVLPNDTPEEIANEAINLLLTALGSTKNSEAVRFLVNGLGDVGGNLSTDVGHQAVTKTVHTIEETRETSLWRVLSLGLASVSIELDRAGKFTASDAPSVVKHLAWAMDVTVDPVDLKRLAEALAAIAAKLPTDGDQKDGDQKDGDQKDGDQKELRLAIQQILKSMEVTHDPDVIGTLASGWQALAGRMTDDETRDAFIKLQAANEDSANLAARPSLCMAAVALATAATPDRAKDALGYLLKSLHRDHSPEVLQILLEGIEKLTPKVPPADVNAAKAAIIAITGEQDRMNDQVMNRLMKALDALPGDIDKLELIELLKAPFCTGEARQTLLKMIESQTKLKFDGNPWKLVASAKEAGIDPQVFPKPVQRPQSVKPANASK
jgi:hypothetical protein